MIMIINPAQPPLSNKDLLYWAIFLLVALSATVILLVEIQTVYAPTINGCVGPCPLTDEEKAIILESLETNPLSEAEKIRSLKSLKSIEISREEKLRILKSLQSN